MRDDGNSDVNKRQAWDSRLLGLFFTFMLNYYKMNGLVLHVYFPLLSLFCLEG